MAEPLLSAEEKLSRVGRLAFSPDAAGTIKTPFMLFNSFDFLLFFPTVAILYYLIPARFKRGYLVTVSYLFYLNWNPDFAVVLVTMTMLSYMAGRYVLNRPEYRRVGIITTFVLLVFTPLIGFKYLNFINENVFGLLSLFGLRLQMPSFVWLMPVGLSFYSFQIAGYLIDVYKRRIEPEKNLLDYFNFVSFFLQITAGPIGRANQLLPQLKSPRKAHPADIVQGGRWMLWGYVMKVVVADRLSLYVDAVFNNLEQHNGTTIWIAAFFFSVQIYCDFAGYSFIALGCAKTMGIDLINNFARPYMAQSVGEFWRRWHISLSTWFRDYVYIPLGGNRCGAMRTRLNLMLTFALSGLWHGASWTFVAWGGVNGGYQVAGKALLPVNAWVRKKLGFREESRFIALFNLVITFLLMTLAWVFFRANSIGDAFDAFRKMAFDYGSPYISKISSLLYCIFGSMLILLADILQERCGRHPLLENQSIIIRYLSYVSLIVLILLIGVFDGGQFIYIQF